MRRNGELEPMTEARIRSALREIGELAPPVPDFRASPVKAMRRRPRPRLLPAAGLAAVAAIAIGSAAVAASSLSREEPPKPSPIAIPSQDPVRQHVDQVANQLVAFQSDTGYGNTVIDYDTATVTLRWNGALPAPVQIAIDQAPSDVTVITRPADYSAATLLAAEDRVVSASQSGRWHGSIVSAAPAPDMGGLIVESTDPASVTAADLEQVAGVPVTVQPGDPIHE